LTAIFLLIFFYKKNNYALILLYCLPLVPLYSLSSIKVAAIKGKKKILDSVVLELAIKPFIFFLVILLLLISDKFNVTSIIFGNVFSALIYFILTDTILKKRIKILSINTFTCKKKELIKKILPFSGIAIASFINIELITLLLGYISGSREVAFLKCANNLSLIVALPLNIIELTLSPYITSLYYSDNKIRLQNIIIIISFLALISSLFPVVILLIFGKKIIIFLYGYEYISACNELFILALSYLIVNTIGISMQLLYATEYHIEAFRISIYGSVATIILCLIMIPLLGGTGAAIALGSGKIFRAVFFSFRARKLLNIKTSIIF
jgi:O-antigen/teichoic acid export membrane protein